VSFDVPPCSILLDPTADHNYALDSSNTPAHHEGILLSAATSCLASCRRHSFDCGLRGALLICVVATDFSACSNFLFSHLSEAERVSVYKAMQRETVQVRCCYLAYHFDCSGQRDLCCCCL
jgi:hypothetical protein